MKCIMIWHMMKNTGKIKFEIVIFRGVDFVVEFLSWTCDAGC